VGIIILISRGNWA